MGILQGFYELLQRKCKIPSTKRVSKNFNKKENNDKGSRRKLWEGMGMKDYGLDGGEGFPGVYLLTSPLSCIYY